MQGSEPNFVDRCLGVTNIWKVTFRTDFSIPLRACGKWRCSWALSIGTLNFPSYLSRSADDMMTIRCWLLELGRWDIGSHLHESWGSQIMDSRDILFIFIVLVKISSTSSDHHEQSTLASQKRERSGRVQFDSSTSPRSGNMVLTANTPGSMPVTRRNKTKVCRRARSAMSIKIKAMFPERKPSYVQ